MSKKRRNQTNPPPSPYRLPLFVCFIIGLSWIFVSSYLYGFSRIYSNWVEITRLPIDKFFSGTHLFYFLHSGLNLAELICFFSVAAFGGRRLIVRSFRAFDLKLSEELLFGLGLGLGIFSLLALALGSFGLFELSVLRLVFLITTFLVFLIELKDPSWKKITFYPVPISNRIDFSSAMAGTLIVGLSVINFLGAIGPEVFYDALVYHLALPKLYLINHKIFPTPYNIYSGIPFNTEMLYSWGLALGGEGLSKLIPWGISIALLCAIILWARRFSNLRTGLFAALLFYSCPMICAQTWFSLVELNWCFFAFLAVFGLILGLENPESHGRRWMALVGLLAGLAMGIKYNAFPVIGILLAMLTVKRLHQNVGWMQAASEEAILALAALLAFSPWILKNLAFYHNPIFPFFHELITHAPDAPDWRSLLQDAHARKWGMTFSTWSGFRDLLVGLWSREWEGSGIDSIGIAFLLFLPWIFFVKWKEYPAHQFLLLGFYLSWVAWAFSSRFPRFFIFALPLLAILLAQAIFSDKRSEKFQQLLSLAIILACGINSSAVINNWFQLEGWQVVFGHQDKSEYLQRNHAMYPTPYYAAAEFVNQELPPNSKIFFLEESRGYYFDRNFIATSNFASNPLVTWINQSKDPEQVRDYLKNEGITHIFVNRVEIFRRGSVSPYSGKGQEIFNAFVSRYLRQVFRKIVSSPPAPKDDRQWVEVYEII